MQTQSKLFVLCALLQPARSRGPGWIGGHRFGYGSIADSIATKGNRSVFVNCGALVVT
jgi:hypothetical protein